MKNFTINPSTGYVGVGKSISLLPDQPIEEARNLLADFSTNERDMKTGYIWLDVKGLLFAGKSCSLSLCFFNSHLCEISWSVKLPDADYEKGWPTRKTIDEEILFVRNELRNQLSTEISETGLEFSWGSVWSNFDPKGFLAANGLRYIK